MQIITVSREFGSGGRELARRLADALKLSYYDNEIINEIAKQENLDADYVSRTLDSGLRWNMPIHYARSFVSSSSSAEAAHLLAEQHNIIRRLAAKGSCVIVGRGADAVLSKYTPFRIFAYADINARAARCRANVRPDEEKLTDNELIRKIKQIDKNRALSYRLVSDTPWGDKHGYDFCINTTGINIKEVTPLLADYAQQWFKNKIQ